MEEIMMMTMKQLKLLNQPCICSGTNNLTILCADLVFDWNECNCDRERPHAHCDSCGKIKRSY